MCYNYVVSNSILSSLYLLLKGYLRESIYLEKLEVNFSKKIFFSQNAYMGS